MSNGNGSNPILAFAVGALLVAVCGLGYLAYTDQPPFGPDEASVTIELPDVSVDEG
ncbi:hypothetical protein ACQ5SO_12870 [Rhodovulum sp. DZ06]|uniref:hypothetical protein n=1 Tax=Rhodovulum sp. DZ06 TaxID=3425126 RepID=UPI003D326619